MKKSRIYPLYFAIPVLLLYGIFYLIPITFGEVFAFTDWNIYVSDVHFNGLDNFIQIFTDPSMSKVFWRAIGNTIYYAIGTLVFTNVLALMLALALNKGLKSQTLLRTVFFIPVVLCPLAIGLLFTAMYNPQYGRINTILRGIGLDSLARQWTADPSTSMNSVLWAGIWKGVGFSTVIYIAGLQGIPKDYYEAAAIDGAGGVQRFFRITFPLLISSVTINLFLGFVGGLKIFDLILSITKGGPGTQTQVLATMVYKELSSGRYGMATAYELMLNILIAGFAFAGLSLLKKREVEF